MISDARLDRIEGVLAGRTYGLSVVLEALYDEGNMAAIMRTCDALGVQRVNLLSLGNFKLERKITQGAHKWLDVHQYTDTAACFDALRADGYRIVATHLEGSVPLDAIDFSAKTAIVFGNEARGVSDDVVAHADARVRIPMTGFVQSFNVSVAAAIALYHGQRERARLLGPNSGLTPAQAQRLRARFYRRSVRHSDMILDPTRAYEEGA